MVFFHLETYILQDGKYQNYNVTFLNVKKIHS